MDELLTNAYRDLAGSAQPPPDAVQLVAARREQRRSARRLRYTAAASAGVAAVLGAVLVLTVGGSAPNPGPADALRPAKIPDGVTCPGGSEPQLVDFDHPGYDSFTAMLRTESASSGAYVVDRSHQILYFLRDDGSAHTSISWSGKAHTRWYPDSEAMCQDRQEWSAQPLDLVSPPTSLSLTLGHCWVEPVEFASRTWEVINEDQFGSGGEVPGRFTGSGTAWLTGDVVTYLDDAGARLTLVPEGDTWAPRRGGCD